MQLHLRVVEAVDVPKMDVDSSDPYCIIQVPQVNRTEKTNVINNSLTLRWNQEFHIPINDVATATLTITMKDKDVTKDDKISTLDIPLCSIPFRTVIDQWYSMIPHKKKKGGRLHLVIHIAANGEQPFVQLAYPGAQVQQGMPGMYPPGQFPPPNYQVIPPQGQYQGPPIQGQYPGAPQMQYPPQGQFQGTPVQGQYNMIPPQGQYPGAQPPIQQPIQPPAQQPIQPQPVQQPVQPPVAEQPEPSKPSKPHHNQMDPPPRPPGMSDAAYRKLFSAQKRLLKAALRGGLRIVIRL